MTKVREQVRIHPCAGAIRSHGMAGTGSTNALFVAMQSAAAASGDYLLPTVFHPASSDEYRHISNGYSILLMAVAGALRGSTSGCADLMLYSCPTVTICAHLFRADDDDPRRGGRLGGRRWAAVGGRRCGADLGCRSMYVRLGPKSRRVVRRSCGKNAVSLFAASAGGALLHTCAAARCQRRRVWAR